MPGRGFGDGIDIGDLTEYIKRELNLCDIFLSDSDIREALRDLQGAEEGYGYFSEHEVVRGMSRKLDKDRDTGGAQGLYRSRTRFLVFCYTAKRMRSRELAEAMLRFFVRESQDIVREELALLTEWCIGLKQLQGLVDEDKLRRAFYDVASQGPPLFEEWRKPGADVFRHLHEDDAFDRDGGRDQLQLLVPRHGRLRHVPIPVLPRRNYLEDPPFPRTVHHFPLVAPMHGLHAIRLHQRVQDLRLDGLQFGLENLQRHLF